MIDVNEDPPDGRVTAAYLLEGRWTVNFWSCVPHADDLCSTGVGFGSLAEALDGFEHPESTCKYAKQHPDGYSHIELRAPDGRWWSRENPAYVPFVDDEPPARECHHLDWYDATHSYDPEAC